MPAVTRNAISEAFFKLHPWLYRKSGGRILGKIGPSPILLLNTRGRRTGQPRTNGLIYLDRGDHWAVAASWAGEPKHPVWYLNLMAKPEVTIQVRNRVVDVRARSLEGQEREQVWREICEQNPDFAVYKERTKGVREIPVVLLEPRDRQLQEGPVYTLYGLSCSYFTGKIEAYMQARGIAFRFVEMNRALFQKCSEHTGVAQLPCIQTPCGQWLTDTTAIMEHLEAAPDSGPQIRPASEAAAFLSFLFEDLFDEWFWRPALYYRWAFKDDSRLMSNQLAKTFLGDVGLPLFLRRQFMLRRQKVVYLRKDGVTAKTAPAIEALYKNTLDALNQIFERRPFLLGDRPSEADYGLFGPFFRHFFCDPTPGALMLERAPHVARWVTRMWALRPEQLARTAPIDAIPDDLGYFFDVLANEYLPYLEANARVYAGGAKQLEYTANGVAWSLPIAPYRVACYNELKRRLSGLTGNAKQEVQRLLPDSVLELLSSHITPVPTNISIKAPLGRLWRPGGTGVRDVSRSMQCLESRRCRGLRALAC